MELKIPAPARLQGGNAELQMKKLGLLDSADVNHSPTPNPNLFWFRA